MLSPLTTFTALNCLRSHMTGTSVYASVVPGVLPAVPSDTLYQAGIVPTDVVLLSIKPHTLVVPGSTTKSCSPATVLELAVNGVPVAVKPVALEPVNGVPVVADKVEAVNNPHSVTASEPV